MPDRGRSPFTVWLDGIETVASAVYLILTVVVAAVGATVLGYVYLRGPRSIGSQGEGFYLGVAGLFVLGWALGQLGWLLRRGRRRRTSDEAFPTPTIETGPSSWSIRWGRAPSESVEGQQSFSWSWGAPVTSGSRVFALDQAQLDAARAAHHEGQSWEDIGRLVHPQYDTLDPTERMLFDRALQLAVLTEQKPGTSG